MALTIRILESPAEMAEVEELQRIVWPGSETEVVPVHLLVTAGMIGPDSFRQLQVFLRWAADKNQPPAR